MRGHSDSRISPQLGESERRVSHSTAPLEQEGLRALLKGIGKHVYISKNLNWPKDQDYCRQHHTDLSFFNSQSDMDKLPKAAGGKIAGGWIGLQRDPNNKTAWKWSGGGHITYQNWHDTEPNF
uniref:C-type lectin domain-containing protein n=1 Tax=Amphiprion ocellaris TaxID=80972 RepID=A0AAQ5ZVC5_AMPOC